MKTYTLSFGATIGYNHPHPERTARRSISDDVTFQVWSSRKAMAKTVRMQEQSAPHRLDWRPLVPLGDAEGH